MYLSGGIMKKNKHLAITIIMAVVMVVTSVMVPTSSYAAGYSVDKSVKYAQKWANSYNDSQYKRINDDCTNFVSQCVAAGGKSFVGSQKLTFSTLDWIKGYKYTKDTKRWYNKKYSYKKGFITKNVYCYSASFTFVDSFYEFWKKQKCCSTYSSYSSCKINSSLQNKLKKGDIIQMYDKGEGWHHSMIITSGKKGNWKYCAHTSSAKDKPLSKLNKSGRKFRIIRINY